MENEHDEIASRFKKLRSKPLPVKNVEPEAKIDDEIFEQLDPDYELYDEIQHMEINGVIARFCDEIIDEPEANLNYVYPIYDLKEHPKFDNYYNKAFNLERIVLY